MNKYQRNYYKLLHYYHEKRFFNEEAFHVITTLNDNEVNCFFSLSRKKITEIAHLLSLIAQYQRAKLNHDALLWHELRRKIKLQHSLWSDAAFFKNIPKDAEGKELGFAILAAMNRRQAITWSLRFGNNLSDLKVDIQKPENLKLIILDFIKNS